MTINSVEMLSFFPAWLTRLPIACLAVRFSRITMQFVVIQLPISSSSKEAITATLFLASSSMSSIRSARFSFGSIFRTSTTASVSIPERMDAAFLMSISFKYPAASRSSMCSKISEIMSVSRTRQTLCRSTTVNSGKTSARSFSW